MFNVNTPLDAISFVVLLLLTNPIPSLLVLSLTLIVVRILLKDNHTFVCLAFAENSFWILAFARLVGVRA